MGGTGHIPVADLNRPTLLAAKGGGSMGMLNNGPGILYISNRPYFAWNDGFGVIPIPVGGSFAADGSQDIYGMPAPISAQSPDVVQVTSNGAALSIAFTNPVTQGNFLGVLVSAINPTSGDIPSVTGVTIGGSADNFASIISQVSAYLDSYALAAIWGDFNNNAGGQTTIAITGNNLIAADVGIAIFELGGFYSGSVDKTSGATADSSAISSGTTAPTTAAAEIWLGCICTGSTMDTLPASPWTNIEPVSNQCFGYQIRTTEGTATYSGTSNSTNEWSAVVACLKPQTLSSGTPEPAYVSLLSSSITAPP